VAEVLGSVGARRVGALAAYDAQLRDRVPELLPSGVTVERDGPLLRFLGLAGRGFVVYRDMGGLEGAELDELISRQVEVFAERGEPFEWKPHGHDLPNDLSQRLHAAGFVQEETETIVIAPRGRHRGRRGATARGRFAAGGDEPRRLRTDCGLEQEVWGDEDQWDWLVDMLASEPRRTSGRLRRIRQQRRSLGSVREVSPGRGRL
jgi:hypothetical protein